MMSYTLTYHELCKDRRLLYRFISLHLPITSFFAGDGFDISRNVKCPFHGDDTPSARIFDGDEDGLARLYCYACRRQYTSYDYLKQVLKVNPAMYIRQFYSDTELDTKSAIFSLTSLKEEIESYTPDTMDWKTVEQTLAVEGITETLVKFYNLTDRNRYDYK